MTTITKVAKNSRRGARPGERRGGRQKGTPNKMTVTLKQAVLDTFATLGGSHHMVTWARKHPSDFYRIAGRLIPPGVPVIIPGLEGGITAQSAAVVRAMGSGAITPEQANTVLQALAAHAKVIEAEDIQKRLATIEGALAAERKRAAHGVGG